MSGSASELTPNQVLEEALKLLTRERAKASGFGYPAQVGPLLPPMSTLEQRRQELQQRFREKGRPPYGGKVAQALGREREGLSGAAIDQLLREQQAAQAGFRERSILPALRSQFGATYIPREAAFRGLTGEDIARNLREMQGTLGEVQRGARTLQEKQNLATAEAMQALGASKEAQRERLLSQLRESAQRKHEIGAMDLAAQRAARQEESTVPYERLRLLEQALEKPARALGMEGLSPEIARQQGLDTLKALQAVGVDISKPAAEWAITKPTGVYPGKRVAEVPMEMRVAWDTLERLHPSLKESGAAQRKALEKEALQGASIGQKAVGKIPEAMRGRIENLEHQAQERLRRDIGVLSQHYIGLGQYGSPQHQKVVEERAAEVNRALLEQRNALLEKELRSQLGHATEEGVGGLTRLMTHGREREREIGDLMKRIHGMEQTGVGKFKSRQDELEELYRNYQNEKMWELPHMRGQIQTQTLRSILGNLPAGVSYPEEFGRRIYGYDDLHREVQQLRTDAERVHAQYRTTQEANIALQQQLAQRQAAEQSAAALAAQRAAQIRQQQEAEARKAAQQTQLQAAIQALPPPPPPAPVSGFNQDPRQADYIKITQYLSALPWSGFTPLHTSGIQWTPVPVGRGVVPAYQHAQMLHQQLMQQYPQEMARTQFGTGTLAWPTGNHITNAQARKILGI